MSSDPGGTRGCAIRLKTVIKVAITHDWFGPRSRKTGGEDHFQQLVVPRQSAMHECAPYAALLAASAVKSCCSSSFLGKAGTGTFSSLSMEENVVEQV